MGARKMKIRGILRGQKGHLTWGLGPNIWLDLGFYVTVGCPYHF